jgi:hypothetical protein
MCLLRIFSAYNWWWILVCGLWMTQLEWGGHISVQRIGRLQRRTKWMNEFYMNLKGEAIHLTSWVRFSLLGMTNMEYMIGIRRWEKVQSPVRYCGQPLPGLQRLYSLEASHPRLPEIIRLADPLLYNIRKELALTLAGSCHHLSIFCRDVRTHILNQNLKSKWYEKTLKEIIW